MVNEVYVDGAAIGICDDHYIVEYDKGMDELQIIFESTNLNRWCDVSYEDLNFRNWSINDKVYNGVLTYMEYYGEKGEPVNVKFVIQIDNKNEN